MYQSSVTFLLPSFQDNGVYRNPASHNKLSDNYQMATHQNFLDDSIRLYINNMYMLATYARKHESINLYFIGVPKDI